jgi:predicted short-subunit dehydrogenase-like oxidoreductase (DUF2520 family)
MHSQWFLVGAGRCGLQLIRAMQRAGIGVVGAEVRSSRGRTRLRRAAPGVPAFAPTQPIPEAGAILVAVPDSEIAECARGLARRVRQSTKVVLHTSGLVSSDALAPLHRKGCSIGSFHPLVSFPTAAGAPVLLAGVAAAVEGQKEALRCARWLARRLGMTPFGLSAAAKPRYHAGAALAANMTHVLVATARSLLLQVGLPPRLAAPALRRLVSGSVDAALSAHALERLTGPVARCDSDAVRADLSALPPRVRSVYRAVASLAIAEMQEGELLNEKQVRQLVAALTAPT